MKILEKIDLKKYSGLAIGGTARYFAEIHTNVDMREAWHEAHERGLALFPIGDGTNTVFTDTEHNFMFIRICNDEIYKTYDGPDFANVMVGGGKNWDALVAWSVANNLSGIEALSAIPGTVGASPIQNIGAYGSEVSQTITSIEVFDTRNGEFVTFQNPQCEFTYRDSFFKKNLGTFITMRVTFQLSKKAPIIPQYKDVQLYFMERGQKEATLAEIRNAIIEIRARKLPDVTKVPNCGSFFKNPIIPNATLTHLMTQFPNLPSFKVDENHSKLYAGWLIEKVGLKGHMIGPIHVYANNALVLTNPNRNASFLDLQTAITHIQMSVRNVFGIELEVEPNII